MSARRVPSVSPAQAIKHLRRLPDCVELWGDGSAQCVCTECSMVRRGIAARGRR